jgi:hypothetical protein
MFGYRERIPIKVLTDKGVVPIDTLVPGEFVYEYHTGNLLEIKDIVDLDVDDVYEVEYSDHRKSYYQSKDYIYLGNSVSRIGDFFKNKFSMKLENINSNFTQFPLEYEKNRIRKQLVPDPYIAGALLIYGDLNLEFINLPSNMNIPTSLLYKYNLDYGNTVDGNKNTFICLGDPYKREITWNKFFPLSNFYAKTHNNNDPIIPNEYLLGNINDREQFIRGIFDIGCDFNVYKDFIAISHSEELMLNEVQKILWSLGILSHVVYNPKYETGNRLYHLIILGDYNNYPGLFYNINKIEKSIENNNMKEDFKLQLKKIKWKCIGYTSNIILDKKYMFYITDNFLPRISL